MSYCRAGALVLLLSGCEGAGIPSGIGPVGGGPVAFVPSRSDPQCTITRIIDGDTIAMTCGALSDTVQLMGFDAPEAEEAQCRKERRLARSAAAALTTILANADVIVPRMYGRDGRDRAQVGMHVNGTALSELMTVARVAVPGSTPVDWCS
ncbi:hypothetical protein [Poseidonocella sedimentorum]|uniref:Nuclease homologue n=1 Tax=Poseidonocella sedimentorum TaxID=871652 RepID=A0A1I6CP72_9RHOB|nr:hypothetical protein [Poseidonocella sedimentorum]SFQ94968.1 hypothetical protein SAMN04515673_101131 [Poseidonocella sedimentorum]